MFSVILYNWYDDEGTLHNQANEERQVMVIPFTGDNKPCMINPSIKEDMGKAPSFDFTVNPGMPYYNAYRPLKTLIRIDYNNTDNPNTWKTIFFGRVVTVNTSSLRQVKSIHAEGMYTAFADTVQEGIEEDFQIKKTAYQLYQEIIATHNSQVGDEWWKKVSLDEAVCNVDTDAESKKRDSSSWQTTQNALNQLVSSNGGYMRIRVAHDARDGIPFKLDWYKKYYRDLDKDIGPGHRPCFELAKNILDLSSSQTLSELFTRVIPIGHKANASGSSTSGSDYSSSAQKKESSMIYLTPRVINVEDLASSLTTEELTERFQSCDEFANAYNYYGNIYKTVNFPNAYNADLLSSYAHDWIKKNYYGAIKAFTVKAVDMKMVGETDNTDDIIMAGDCVDIIYPIYDQNGNRTLSTKRRLVCKSVQINLYNPEQNTYSIGIPNDAIDFEYGQKKKTGRASTTAAAASSPERPGPGTKQYDLSFDKAARYLYWFYYSNNWGSIEVAQKNNAYSWRTGGRGLENFINLQDRKPHNTFTTYGMPKRVSFDYEDVTITEYDPAHPQDPDYVIGTKTERQRVERVEFLHVLINGITKPVRVMGHYWTSPLQLITEGKDAGKYFYSGVTPKPATVKNGYHYGFGWVENTDDCLAFSWSEYLNKQYNIQYGSTPQQPIDAFFHFPNVFGRYVEQSGLNSADSSDSSDTGGNAGGKTDSDGSITYYDENGQPSAKIFPDSGRASYGPAIEHYDPETGEVVEPDPETGEYPENTITRQMVDAQGNPIWYTTVNTPITYRGTDGQEHTINGAIVANDIQLPEIDSFKTKIAIIDDLIVQRATINQLRAFEAILGDSAHEAYDENGNFIGYEGTQIETNANNAITVSGIFEKDSDGHIKTDPVTGKPKIIKGGATVVYPNGSEHGLWDKGELQAGIFTWHNAQTNDYVTGIKGDQVILGGSGTLTADDLNSWAKNPSNNKGGVFAKYIVSKRIKVGEIEATDDDVDIIGNLRVQGGASVEKLLYVGNYSTGSYSLISGTNITSNMFNVRSNGTLHFNGPSIEDQVNIGYKDAYGLIDSQSHVVIEQDASTNECVLWYLPPKIMRAGTNRDPAEGNAWVKASTFRKAASSSSETYLYGSWSSGIPSVFTAYTTDVPDRYGAHIKEFNIIFENQSAQAYDHLTVNHGAITVNANGTIDVPITVDSIEYSDGGADDDQYITRFSKTISGIDLALTTRFNALEGSETTGKRTVSIMHGSDVIYTSGYLNDYGNGYSQAKTDYHPDSITQNITDYTVTVLNAAGDSIGGPYSVSDIYNQGKHDATLTTSDWTNGRIVISNTDNSDENINISVSGLYIYESNFTWTNNVGTYTDNIVAGVSKNGSTAAYRNTGRTVNVTVDVNSLVNNGVLDIPLFASSWQNGARSVSAGSIGPATPDSSAPVYISLTAGSVTPNSGPTNKLTGTFSCPILDGSTDTGLTVNININQYLTDIVINHNDTYIASSSTTVGYSRAIVNVPVKLDTNYVTAGNSDPITAVIPSPDGTGSQYLRIYYTDTGRQGTGTSTTRTIDFKVGTDTIETLNITDYADGYRAGQSDVVIPDLNDRWNTSTYTHEIYAGSKSFTTTFGGSQVTANRYMDVTLGDITINSSTSISVPISVNTVDYGTGGEDDERTPRYTTTINKNISSLLGTKTINTYGSYTINAADENLIGFSSISVNVPAVGVKYLGSYTPSGASEPIHAVVPTTDSGKYNYIEISVDEGSLVNSGTTSGYRRVKVNAAGNGQTTPTAIKEWRIDDYGDGYSDGFDAVASPSFEKWTTTNVTTDTISNAIWFETDDKISGTSRHGSHNVYLTADDWTGSSTKTKKVYVRDNTASGVKVCQLTITAPSDSGTTMQPWVDYNVSATDKAHWDANVQGTLGANTYMRVYDQVTGNTITNSAGTYAVWKTPEGPNVVTTIKLDNARNHVTKDDNGNIISANISGTLASGYQYWNFVAYDDGGYWKTAVQTNQSSNGIVVQPYDYSISSNGTYYMNEFVRAVSVNVTLGDIDIPTNYIYTTAGYPQGTELTRLRNLIRQAIEDNESVVFRVDAGGSSKYYNLQF